MGVWGGASKGVISALLRERLGKPVDVAIDLNPAKQGLYLLATGLRVHAPEEGLAKLLPGSPLYIMNSICAEEIKAMSGGHYDYILESNMTQFEQLDFTSPFRFFDSNPTTNSSKTPRA